jgi:riboflavin synthase alpha subunit
MITFRIAKDGTNCINMRLGIILSYSINGCCGTIKDNNGQKIQFNNSTKTIYKQLEIVKFSIDFVTGSLRATNIRQVKDNKGAILSISDHSN